MPTTVFVFRFQTIVDTAVIRSTHTNQAIWFGGNHPFDYPHEAGSE